MLWGLTTGNAGTFFFVSRLSVATFFGFYLSERDFAGKFSILKKPQVIETVAFLLC